MAHEKGLARFFTYLNLFMAMMLTWCWASNLLVMFVGWEGVGLCSYLLIGFFYDRRSIARTGLSCADAGRKAFLVNRIGDFAFLIGCSTWRRPIARWSSPRSRGDRGGRARGPSWLLTGVGILLFVGACGKSAQIPLYVWLPDAMAGPTPVSALIHAATMVTAGCTWCAGCRRCTRRRPGDGGGRGGGYGDGAAGGDDGSGGDGHQEGAGVLHGEPAGVHVRGGGVGSVVAAMFHLMTHAFFKALLFLGAGSVIHGMSGRAGHPQDGRSAVEDAGDLPDVRDRDAVDRWVSAAGGFLVEGRDSCGRRCRRATAG
jgi:NADH-quinone oxidoreductase subunit L